MNLEELKNKLIKIKNMGFVPSQRKGTTGVGYTLETLLDIPENNFVKGDLLSVDGVGDIEVKSHRSTSNSLITLFTFNKDAWIMKPLDAIRKYGTQDKKGRLGMYFTLSVKPNNSGIFLYISEQYCSVRSIDGTEIAKWFFNDLENQFEKKIHNLLLVTANIEKRNKQEFFHFVRAQLMTGTSSEKLKQEIQNETIKVDLRLHDAKTRARNHGTGFRLYERDLPLIFNNAIDLI